MLKEMIQKIVKDPEARMEFQSGQLQLAGMTAWERKALIDVIKNDKQSSVVRTSRYWF